MNDKSTVFGKNTQRGVDKIIYKITLLKIRGAQNKKLRRPSKLINNANTVQELRPIRSENRGIKKKITKQLMNIMRIPTHKQHKQH